MGVVYLEYSGLGFRVHTELPSMFHIGPIACFNSNCAFLDCKTADNLTAAANTHNDFNTRMLCSIYCLMKDWTAIVIARKDSAEIKIMHDV